MQRFVMLWLVASALCRLPLSVACTRGCIPPACTALREAIQRSLMLVALARTAAQILPYEYDSMLRFTMLRFVMRRTAWVRVRKPTVPDTVVEQ